MEYSYLTDLNSDRDTWMVKIRVCRMWESTNPRKNDELISIDMIFIDEKENLMHAVLRKHLAARFKHRLREGSLYSVRNLEIVASVGVFRPLTNEKKIQFMAITSVIRLDEGVVQIALYGFQFIRREMEEARANDNTILSGCLSAVGGVEVVATGSKKRDIKIVTNYSKTRTITLWGKLGELFDPNLYQEVGPYVVIVTSTRVKTFSGEINFCTSNSSRIYVNMETTFVASLRERFSNLCNRVQLIENHRVNKPRPEEDMFTNRMNIVDLVKTVWSKDLTLQGILISGQLPGTHIDLL